MPRIRPAETHGRLISNSATTRRRYDGRWRGWEGGRGMALSINYDDEVVHVERLTNEVMIVFTKRGAMFIVRFTPGNDFPQVIML